MRPLRTHEPYVDVDEIACPRDGGALTEIVIDETAVDRCTRCGGTWFDEAELRRVAHDREVEKLAAHVGNFPAASGFECPRCEGACVAAFVGEVQVDTCTVCRGVWLDAGELDEARRTIEVNRTLGAASSGFVDFLRRL